MRIGAVILAAGAGSRFGGELPKQFVACAGAPLLAHAARAFRDAGFAPVAAVPPAWVEHCRDRLGIPAIPGGGTRTETVARAASWAAAQACDLLFLHAANRPLLRPELLGFMARQVTGFDGLAACERVAGGLVDTATGQPAERDRFRLTATPELVGVAALTAALAAFTGAHTLAVDALIAAGRRVGFVAPGYPNLKVTYPGDLHAAACLLGAGLPPTQPEGPFVFGPGRAEGAA